jgi:hypothetical protein
VNEPVSAKGTGSATVVFAAHSSGVHSRLPRGKQKREHDRRRVFCCMRSATQAGGLAELHSQAIAEAVDVTWNAAW